MKGTTTKREKKLPTYLRRKSSLPYFNSIFLGETVMRILSLACSAFAFAVMTSVAQAEPAVMKQSEPMRLTAPQMNNITAGGLTVFSYASGNEFSYSRIIDFSITPHPDALIAATCCGRGTIFAGIVFIPHSTRLDSLHGLAHYGLAHLLN